jgi:hypothetical protein
MFLYDTMKALSNARNPQEMIIKNIWPQAEWWAICKNLQASPGSDAVKTTWYRVNHIIPTNNSLHWIHKQTNRCKSVGNFLIVLDMPY